MVFSMSSCDGSMLDISVNPDPIAVGYGGTQIFVAVDAPAEWIVESNDAWLTVGKVDNSSIAVQAEPNQGNRTGSITITALGMSQTFAVNQQLTVDDMVGTWLSTELWVEPAQLFPFNNNHNVYITKIDDTTVEITNLMWLTGDDTIHPSDKAIATVNSAAGTISIPFQLLVPTVSADGWDTYLARHLNAPVDGGHAPDWGVGFDDIPVVNGNKIDFGAGGFVFNGFFGSYNCSFFIISEDPDAPGDIYYYSFYCADTVWTKVSDDPTPIAASDVPQREKRIEMSKLVSE